MVVLTYAWFSISTPPLGLAEIKAPFVTVLIAARNEEFSLMKTLKSIGNSNFPRSNYEVIVVDDHSMDNTHLICSKAISDGYVDFVLRLPEGCSGKKMAIEYGVKNAKGTIVLMTDADCQVSQDWIKAHAVRYVHRPETQMVYGPVQYDQGHRSIFKRMLNAELTGLVGVGASSLALGSPSMINAANMSFRKHIFNEVGGYSDNAHIPTGDDEFLLRKVHGKWPKGICFLKDQQSIVVTDAPETVSEFFNQRRRWASKWKDHNDLASKLVPVVVFLLNALLIISMLALITGELTPFWGSLLFLKLVVDTSFVSMIRSSLRLKNEVWDLVVLQIIYPFYVVLFGIASNFGSYQWKNRVYHTSVSDLSEKPKTNHE